MNSPASKLFVLAVAPTSATVACSTHPHHPPRSSGAFLLKPSNREAKRLWSARP
jgi:hypothetical protein